MRAILIAAAVGVSLLSWAAASEFVVVRSTDPAIARSTTFKAGERASVAPGARVTLMGPNGEIVTLSGDAVGQVLIPAAEAERSDFLRLSALRGILTRPMERRAFGAVRSDESCPSADTLTSFDLILEADEAGCLEAAGTALEAYLDAGIEAQGEAKPFSELVPEAPVQDQAGP